VIKIVCGFLKISIHGSRRNGRVFE